MDSLLRVVAQATCSPLSQSPQSGPPPERPPPLNPRSGSEWERVATAAAAASAASAAAAATTRQRTDKALHQRGGDGGGGGVVKPASLPSPSSPGSRRCAVTAANHCQMATWQSSFSGSAGVLLQRELGHASLQPRRAHPGRKTS